MALKSCMAQLSSLAHMCTGWYKRNRGKPSISAPSDTMYSCSDTMTLQAAEEPNLKLCFVPDSPPRRQPQKQPPQEQADKSVLTELDEITNTRTSTQLEVERRIWGEAQPQYVPIDMIRDRLADSPAIHQGTQRMPIVA